ncbi:MAG: hypothetical protein WBA71_05305 [Candidatus Humimicrobiia bacterium]
MTIDQCLLIKDLKRAHKIFLKNEPRDLFYKVATELIKLSIKGKTKVKLSEALAVLLQTWNRAYYQYRGFDNDHFKKIDNLVEKYSKSIITSFRNRSLLSLLEKEKDKIFEIFSEFEEVLGPVGAAKSLHLLAPRFFPIWDRTIAKAYGIYLGTKGTNAYKYWSFMKISCKQCKTLDGRLLKEINPLKYIDEYNYCHYTKNWI